jgi:hypothetical protein
MEIIKNYTPPPWTKKKCSCGDPMCDRYHVSVCTVSGLFSRQDAEITILAPILYERNIKMLEVLKEIVSELKSDDPNLSTFKRDLLKKAEQLIKSCES